MYCFKLHKLFQVTKIIKRREIFNYSYFKSFFTKHFLTFKLWTWHYQDRLCLCFLKHLPIGMLLIDGYHQKRVNKFSSSSLKKKSATHLNSITFNFFATENHHTSLWLKKFQSYFPCPCNILKSPTMHFIHVSHFVTLMTWMLAHIMCAPLISI